MQVSLAVEFIPTHTNIKQNRSPPPQCLQISDQMYFKVDGDQFFLNHTVLSAYCLANKEGFLHVKYNKNKYSTSITSISKHRLVRMLCDIS
jgi:hypothetical protein